MIGIDVSNGQGNIDWNKVKAAGCEFVIIRCGWGSDAVKQDDPKFNEYVLQCEKLGIPYGVYLYSYALNVESAKSEAQHTLRLLQGKRPKHGVWFDMEDADHYKRDHGMNVYQQRQLITDICKTYCETMMKAGYNAGIYASYDYFKNVIYRDQVCQYPFWLAQWGPSKPSMECSVWQYTNKGHCDGIYSDGLDMDILYPDNRGPIMSLPVGSSNVPTCEVKITKEIVVPGSTGSDTKLMQLLLNYKGYNCGGVDGVYGSKTKEALGAYQSRNPECGSVDYKCGSKTWASLLS